MTICRPLTLLIFLVILSGCSKSSSSKYTSPDLGPSLRRTPSGGNAVSINRREQWELWGGGRDLRGAPFSVSSVLDGDDALQNGRVKDALSIYNSIRRGGLSYDEEEALVLRVAGTYLSLGDPKQALNTISTFYSIKKRSPAEVAPELAIVLGYGFRRTGNNDQALAWFNTATQSKDANASVRNSASEGIRSLLGALSDTEFERIAEVWHGDNVISPIVGQERRGRALGQGRGTVALQGLPPEDGTFLPSPSLDVNESFASYDAGTGFTEIPSTASATIGVILPLSGQYTSLGASVKGGIELALEDQTPPGFVKANFRDSATDPVYAAQVARELVTVGGANAIIGPLITEQASNVASETRSLNVPLISFSKSVGFETGGGVFRLAPTSESQVETLVDVSTGILGVKNFGIVFPDSAGGQEFASLFQESLRKRGVEATYVRSYPKDNLDVLNRIADEVQQAKVDGVFLPDTLTAAARLFAGIPTHFKTRILPLGIGTWDNEAELRNSEGVLHGAVFPSLFHLKSERPEVVSFVQKYSAKYGQKPDLLAAQGYDAATLAIATFRRMYQDNAPFTDTLSRVVKFDGLTGSITVSPQGEIERRYRVLQLGRGKLIDIEATTPEVLAETESVSSPTQPRGEAQTLGEVITAPRTPWPQDSSGLRGNTQTE